MNTIILRDFEERDIDFIYRCKNDEKLNEMIVGQFRPFSYEEAVKWVHGCMGEHETFKFWAVATNDAEKRIVGWVSLSEINKSDRTACHHGLVIGDSLYRDGTAMFEAMLLSMGYAFDNLKTHRLYGSCLSEHKISPYLLSALGFTLEGTRRDATFKNGRFFDINDSAILENEYLENKLNNIYETNCLIRNFIRNKKHK